MKNRIFGLIILLIIQIQLFPQDDYYRNIPLTNQISQADSAWLSNLPEIKLPEHYRYRNLPSELDNSTLPFFRPIFSQSGASCGQSGGIGYNFTYEINRARNLPADTSINQYPTHFTWNFMNGGSGWYGVSYFHSFEILRVLGTPNVFEYGGMYIDEGITWITGYDKYYSAMKNRITGLNQIKANTTDGLLTLKHWLNDHLDGSAHGGVAGFYAGSPYGYKFLPPGTPEAGKPVIIAFSGGAATHAMTIVGFNDSIRYDYNNDGQFTNDIDINNDQVVDMKDWEIGAVRFANSYGDTWADSGFCYMTYKVIADELADGGIWNHSLHLLDVKAAYTPELTMKLSVKHDSRDKIKIMAGIANDTAACVPEKLLTFPVFNYQGENQYMQGGRNDEAKKTIEIGLDLTPLLSFVTPGKPSRFFVVIDENDPGNEGSGEIVSFSIMDYTNGGITEIHCPDEHVPIAGNGTTRLSVIHSLDFDKINIVNNLLPPVVNGQPYQVQLTSEGGTLPCKWELTDKYYQQSSPADFPQIEAVPLTTLPGLDFSEQEIAFDFPFYGETFNKLYIHKDGFIMFDGDLYPWPYYNDAFLLFRSMKNISVFLNKPLKYYTPPTDGDGMWYEGDETHAAFRWSKPLYANDKVIGHAEFAAILYPDGTVRYFYNDIEVDEDLLWYAGVSRGNKEDYKTIGLSTTKTLPRKGAYTLIPDLIPAQLQISSNGLITGTPALYNAIKNITAKVTDDKYISSEKTFQLTDGLIFSYLFHTNNDTIIEIGDTVYTDVKIKNITTNPFHNVQMNIGGNDPFLEIIDGLAIFGTINPGQTITVSNAQTMTVANSCPDRYSFIINVTLESTEKNWTGKMIYETTAPGLYLSKYLVDDDNNHKLDPGETVNVLITITNDGSADAANVFGKLTTTDPFITINTSAPVSFGNLASGQSQAQSFSVKANWNTPISHDANFIFEIASDPELSREEPFTLVVGQIPVLVINLAQNSGSSEAMITALQSIGIEFQVANTVPQVLELYRSVFLCLGTFYQNTPLTQDEGELLASYLNGGGKLYMEGVITWKQDPQTAVHPKFMLQVASSSWITYVQLKGVPNTFTENFLFNSNAQHSLNNYYFQPKESAFPIFRLDTSSIYNSAIAYENEIYRTIASFTEFGSLESNATLEDRETLMREYLHFFGLTDFITGTTEPANNWPETNKPDIFPNPFSSETTISFSVAKKSDIDITIYDFYGKTIARLLKSQLFEQGDFSIKWDLKDESGNIAPPGIYFYQIRIGENIHTGKMIRMD